MNFQNVPTEKLEYQLNELKKVNSDHLNIDLFYAIEDELKARKADRIPISDCQDEQNERFYSEQSF